MKRNNPNSIDQLTFDFLQAGNNLQQAIETFKVAAERLSNATTIVPKQDDALRKTVRKLVGILVDQSGLTFHAAWVLAYNELYKRTGWHAVVVSTEEKAETHLDSVQKHNMLSALEHTLTSMLRAPEYCSPVALPA